MKHAVAELMQHALRLFLRIEITVVPKQVVRVQEISLEVSAPTLRLRVDANSRSTLHYEPASKASGTSLSLSGPESHEVWVPCPDKTKVLFEFDSPHFRAGNPIPSEIIDPNNPLYLIYGALPTADESSTQAASLPNPSPAPDFAEADESLILMADPSARLTRARLKEGVNDVSQLSPEQKTILEAFLKECVTGNTVIPAVGQVFDNFELLYDFTSFGKKSPGKNHGQFYFKMKNGQPFVVFKGNLHVRRYFRGTQHAIAKNSKLSILTIGQGLGNAVKEGLPSLAKKASTLGLIIVGAVDVYEWLQEDEKFLTELVVQLLSDAFQMVVSSVVAALVVASILIVTEITAPIWVIVAGTILVGVGVGFVLTAVDNHFQATKQLKQAAVALETPIRDFFNTFISECESRLRQHYRVPYNG